MIQREDDPITGVLNGLGIAFLFWGFIFIAIAVIRYFI